MPILLGIITSIGSVCVGTLYASQKTNLLFMGYIFASLAVSGFFIAHMSHVREVTEEVMPASWWEKFLMGYMAGYVVMIIGLVVQPLVK